MSLFATMTDERMCAAIDSAKHRVIFAAPGVGLDVAHALVRAAQRISRGGVQVVLDVSPSVARLGYGVQGAVKVLSEAQIELHNHAGLRIGVLICDDGGWSFSTAPKLVERDPSGDGDAFNAISLTPAQVIALRGELPVAARRVEEDAKAVARDEMPAKPEDPGSPAKISVFESKPLYSIVGTEKVSQEQLVQVDRALELAPPQQFDLARQTMVYTALIQFVELTLEGFNMQSRRVQLPKTLPLIASKDNEVKSRLVATLKLLDNIEKPKELRDITAQLEELRAAFLIPVGQAGRVILTSKKRDFEEELAGLERQLDSCRQKIVVSLSEALQRVVTTIKPDLARAVLAEKPARFRGLFPTTIEAAENFVDEELRKAFPTAEKLVEGMKISKFYKDVTYDVLRNKDFMDRVLKEIPPSVLGGALLDEQVAAKAVASPHSR